jgi:uncharacterized phiE125 gp8 family phage protein
MQLAQYLDNSEPLTLDDVKNHLRIDTADDDQLLSNIIIPGVRAQAEAITSSVLRKAKMIYTLKQFPRDYLGGYIKPITLSISNCRSIDSVVYRDNSGAIQTITTIRSLIDNNQVKIINSAPWPNLINPADDAIKITLTAGYTQEEFASFLPSVMQWMLLAAGWAYNQRDLFSNDAKLFAQMPDTYVNALLQSAHQLPSF